VLTYAQNFEDVMLERLFKDVVVGFYVDIGAWDPTLHSVTKHFYDRGWRGVNVEPIVERCLLFDVDRPRDINLCKAVGPEPGSMTFFECQEESYLSTLDPAVAAEMGRRGLTVREHRIDVVTLDEVFETYCPATVEFLKIDVEGFEGPLLKSFDLARYRPRVLVVEATIPGLAPSDFDHVEEIGTWQSWEPEVLGRDYQLAYFDGLNRFYLRAEDAHRENRLKLPPGVFDAIENAALAKRIAALSEDGADKARVITDLERELAAVAQDRDVKDELLHRLGQELTAAHNEREAQQALLDQARSDLETHAIRNQQIEGKYQQALGRNDQLRRRLRRKDEILMQTSSTLIGYRRALGGTLEIAYRSRRSPGHLFGGGRYYGSQRADTGTRLRVGVDAMSIHLGVSGGVEVYMRTLVQALLTMDGVGVILLCLDTQLETLRKSFGDAVAFHVYSGRPLFRTAKMLDAKLRSRQSAVTVDSIPASFARLREEAGVDLLHCPVQCYSLFDFSVPAVFHLHDLQHLHFPENFRVSDVDARNYYYGLSADLSDVVVATSDYVRNDIISKMHVPADKVALLPATWDPQVEAGLREFSPEDARRHYRLPPCFGLYPAQFWPHKNHAHLVEALSIVRSRMRDADFKLVFTGNRAHSGWPKVAETIERLDLTAHVICLDYVPVGHMAALYKCAAFCVMPSTFEASSYAVIEAQLFGCPAMCSNVTSLPELMRDGAGLLFDAFDIEDMAAKMMTWLRDPEDAAAHAARAAEKVRREHCMASYAAGIADIYQRVVPI
jgi:FkbM family methyltransferase